MRISSNGTPEVSGPTQVSPASAVSAPSEAHVASRGDTTAAEPLQSAALQPARQALSEMPEIDQAKVDAVRDALSRGEIKFDAGKLAGLIARYHGGQR